MLTRHVPVNSSRAQYDAPLHSTHASLHFSVSADRLWNWGHGCAAQRGQGRACFAELFSPQLFLDLRSNSGFP